jgi:hypothetical protein
LHYAADDSNDLGNRYDDAEANEKVAASKKRKHSELIADDDDDAEDAVQDGRSGSKKRRSDSEELKGNKHRSAARKRSRDGMYRLIAYTKLK